MDDKKLESIIQKIKKLLAMSKSTSENEAAIAAKKVSEILDKYNLSMSAIEAEEEVIYEESINIGLKKMQYWFVKLSEEIGEYTYCRRLWIMKSGPLYVGMKADVITASELFKYLYRTINILATEYLSKQVTKTKGAKISERFQYCAGAAKAISDNMRLKPNLNSTIKGNELVVIKNKKINEYVDTEYPKTQSTKLSSPDKSYQAYKTGYNDGSKIPLVVRKKLDETMASKS